MDSHRPSPRPGVPVSGVLLAAGGSHRLGTSQPKQLRELDGQPLVRRLAQVALAADLAELIVVVGHEGKAVRAALDGLAPRPGRRFEIVDNPAWKDGQSTSVKAGLARMSPTSAAALFLPCDQPYLTAHILDRLIATYRRTGGPAVAPAFLGRRGAPVLFDRSYFPDLARITGDRGGRQLLEKNPEDLVLLELDDPAPLLDVDTAEDWARVVAGTVN